MEKVKKEIKQIASKMADVVRANLFQTILFCIAFGAGVALGVGLSKKK
jgi:ElaB/YqjD/DUF883 family membrane-anchored ribosome-binding protein